MRKLSRNAKYSMTAGKELGQIEKEKKEILRTIWARISIER